MNLSPKVQRPSLLFPLFTAFLLLGLSVPAQAAEAPPAPVKKTGEPGKIAIKEFFHHDKAIPVAPLPDAAKRDILVFVAKRVWPHPDKKSLPFIKRAIATVWKAPFTVKPSAAKAPQIAEK